jgi:hypothetical protein
MRFTITGILVQDSRPIRMPENRVVYRGWDPSGSGNEQRAEDGTYRFGRRIGGRVCFPCGLLGDRPATCLYGPAGTGAALCFFFIDGTQIGRERRHGKRP